MSAIRRGRINIYIHIYAPHSSTLIRVHFIPHSLILSTLFYPRNNFVDNVEQVLRDSNHHEPPGFRPKLKYGLKGENRRPKLKKNGGPLVRIWAVDFSFV